MSLNRARSLRIIQLLLLLLLNSIQVSSHGTDEASLGSRYLCDDLPPIMSRCRDKGRVLEHVRRRRGLQKQAEHREIILRRVFDKFLGVVGGFFCLGSLLMVSASIGDLITGSPDTPPGVLVGLLIFFSGVAFGGGYLAKRKLFGGLKSKQSKALSDESIILKLAMEHNGRLNITQIAAFSSLSVGDAQEAIKVLTDQGVAEFEYTDEGEVYYEFPGLKQGANRKSKHVPLSTQSVKRSPPRERSLEK